jgi:hypothetical protein
VSRPAVFVRAANQGGPHEERAIRVGAASKRDIAGLPRFLAGFQHDGNGIVDLKMQKYRIRLCCAHAKRRYKILDAMN